MIVRCRMANHSLGNHLLGHSNRVTVLGELVWGQNILENIVTKVKTGTWVPFSCVLKELLEIMPVTLKQNILSISNLSQTTNILIVETSWSLMKLTSRNY